LAFWLALGVCLGPPTLSAFTLLTYNVGGNGTTDWSTNAPQVQAIGRQMVFLQPDLITFNEVPFTNSWQMTNFVTAYLPGYFLARYSGTDGFLRSVIASRFPIVREQKWLDGAPLDEFGYAGRFARDLFEAEVLLPGSAHPLHVFTTHLPPTVAPLLVSPPPVPLTPSRYGGVIGQALESRRPWQLFNPLAPPEFGDGAQNLSVNPVTGQAEGVTLFSFQFKPKPGAKKNTRRAVAPEH
jgi:hypothetical protein